MDVVRVEKQRSDHVRGRERRIEAFGTVKIREGVLPPSGFTIEIRPPDKKVKAGGVSCQLRRDSGDPIGQPVVGERD